MTDAERQAALEAIAEEISVCTRCRLHEGRTRAVPGEGSASTEVVFVGEGPGVDEDRQGRPFVGRAGDLLVKLLASIGWRRDDVFITNVVKCRPPNNRDPQPDEMAACAPFLRRQLEILDPAVVVTLGRFSLGTFMPGARISAAHGTVRPVDPATGAQNALAFAMYHPAAALRTGEIERTSYADIAGVPAALLDSRARRARTVEATMDDRPPADAAAAATPVPAAPAVTQPSAPAPVAPVTQPTAPVAPERPAPEAAAPDLSEPALEAAVAVGPAPSVVRLSDAPADDQLTLF